MLVETIRSSGNRHNRERAFRKKWGRDCGREGRTQNTDQSGRESFPVINCHDLTPFGIRSIFKPHPCRKSRPNMSTSEVIPGTVPPPLLTVDDVANLLKVSTRTIWRMRSCCQLPKPIKVGGGVRWRQGDIESRIAQGCPAAAARDNGTRR